MITLPTITSIAALGLGVFNFWWTQIRTKQGFYLIRIPKFANFETLAFALVNAGDQDLLVTGILLYFEGGVAGYKFYPALPVEGGEDGKADLIQGGKAIEFRINCRHALTPGMFQNGFAKADSPNLRFQRAIIEVSWIDIKGKLRTAHIPHSIFGVQEDGSFGQLVPHLDLQAKHDLIRAAT